PAPFSASGPLPVPAVSPILSQELELMEPENRVYKLMGPVLVRQELQEAKSTVAKRLHYINGEIKRYEGTDEGELERKSEQHRETLGKLQQDFQRAQGKAPARD
ncbi:LOW QUALITY PROTEIN: prefoldin subunit 6, partial [Hemitrygon akajei]|uniref:LOW QUALITY PROTEIN: prefoldin subunit 6 n=1 Tax=Hemitrygon akajei TaxID=2704970 RepID=UPI003BF9DCAA